MTTAATAEMEYETVKTSVWWDIENCEVPRGWDAHAIAQNVSSALLKMKYCGPVSITAYGDTNLIPHAVQQALSSTGVGLNHVPAGVKDASDKKILVDMLLWAIDNPAPANFMLISGDRDFSYALHQLRMRRYNILLAQPPQASVPLVAAAKDVWLWTSLASGGPPLTSGESSQLLNSGRCQVSNYEVLKHPVCEQAQSIKPTASTSDAGDTKDYKDKENNVPRGLPQETRRNMLQNGRGATCESSPLLNNGRCQVSNYEVSKHPVSEQVQSSKPTDSTSDAGDTKDHKTRENQFPIGSRQETRRNNLQNGRGALGESVTACRISNVVCDKFPHLSEKRPISQAAFVESRGTQASVSAKPIQEAELVECKVCQIICSSKDTYKKHTYGKRHQNNLELQSGNSNNISVGPVVHPKDVLEKQKKKVNENRANPNANHVCLLCNVVCQSQIVFDSHLRGKKHASMRRQPEALIDSKKPQEKGVCQKDQPKKTIAEPKPNAEHVCRLCNVVCQSQIVFDSHLRGQKHAAMLSQSELDQALIDSKKLKEKGVQEKKAQPKETVAENHSESQNTQENTNFFEKQNEEFREICGTSESSIKELFRSTKDRVVTVNKQLPNGEFFFGDLGCDIEEARVETVNKQLPNGEARECFDGIVKPVNLSEGATEHLGEVKMKQKEMIVRIARPAPSKLCNLCVVICDRQGLSTVVCDNKGHSTNQKHTKGLIDSKKLQEKGVGDKDQTRQTIAEPKPKAEHVCRLCNVACHSQIVFDSHLRGKKHAAMLSQSEALIDSKKLQEKGVEQKNQPRETIAELQLQSQNAQENKKCFEKHVVMVNQSEALINSRKLEEKVVREKAQPIETVAENQLQSQNTQQNTNFFEKQNEDFREIRGTSESSKKELFPSTKDRVETVNKQLPNGEFFFGDLRCDFDVPREARECYDGIVKPVNLSEGPTEHSGEVKKICNLATEITNLSKRRARPAASKLCILCVVICDSQGLATVFCDGKGHWMNQKNTTAAAFVASDDAQSSVSTKPLKKPEVLQPVWCQVCEISCSSKDTYKNHTYGKRHLQKLELQSAKNENMSKGPAKLSKENAEKKKVLCKNQTAFDSQLKSQNHAAMVKEQAESKEDKEDVKEINAISEKLEQRAFTEPNRESRIPKESRGCLDAIPERVQLPPCVNATEKLKDESKHKTLEPENESAGRKEHSGEAAKREEEIKGQVDNFWTRLWGKKT